MRRNNAIYHGTLVHVKVTYLATTSIMQLHSIAFRAMHQKLMNQKKEKRQPSDDPPLPELEDEPQVVSQGYVSVPMDASNYD